MAKLNQARVVAAPSRAQVFVERFPLRKAVQWSLFVLIAVGVGLGSWKTLTLPAAERYTPGQWRDFVVLGIAQGAVYALIALGYSLVYGILRMINFAHGEVFMAGAYTSFFFADAMSRGGFLNREPAVALVLLLLTAMAGSTLVAVLLERVAYRPLRNAPRLVPLITAIGASFFLQYTFRGLFGQQLRGYPRFDFLRGKWHPLGIPILRTQVVVLIVVAASLAFLTWFVARTKTGKSMRAVAEDKEIASLMGIDVDRVIVTTFAVGGAFAGIAGVLFALVFEHVHWFMGFFPGIKAFTAAVLGGIGSIGGAALGGILIGVAEALGPPLLLAGAHVPSPFQLKDVVAFLVLILVLIFRPGGILGTGEREKV